MEDALDALGHNLAAKEQYPSDPTHLDKAYLGFKSIPLSAKTIIFVGYCCKPLHRTDR